MQTCGHSPADVCGRRIHNQANVRPTVAQDVDHLPKNVPKLAPDNRHRIPPVVDAYWEFRPLDRAQQQLPPLRILLLLEGVAGVLHLPRLLQLAVGVEWRLVEEHMHHFHPHLD